MKFFKILSTAFFIFIIFTIYGQNVFGQQKSGGCIYFTDGSSQEFSSMNCMFMDATAEPVSSLSCYKQLHAYHNNSYKEIEFRDLKKITVLPSKVTNMGVVGQMEVTTKTGRTFTSPCTLSAFWVMLYDDLSGRYKEESFSFNKDGRPIITSIVFY